MVGRETGAGEGEKQGQTVERNRKRLNEPKPIERTKSY